MLLILIIRHNRLAFGEERECLAYLDPEWRPTDADQAQSVECHAFGKWITADVGVKMAHILSLPPRHAIGRTGRPIFPDF